MKIIILEQAKLNTIKLGLGDALVKHTPHYNDKPYTLLNQDSVNELSANPEFEYKNELNLLIHFMNQTGYITCQITKTKNQ